MFSVCIVYHRCNALQFLTSFRKENAALSYIIFDILWYPNQYLCLWPMAPVISLSGKLLYLKSKYVLLRTNTMLKEEHRHWMTAPLTFVGKRCKVGSRLARPKPGSDSLATPTPVLVLMWSRAAPATVRQCQAGGMEVCCATDPRQHFPLSVFPSNLKRGNGFGDVWQLQKWTVTDCCQTLKKLPAEKEGDAFTGAHLSLLLKDN